MIAEAEARAGAAGMGRTVALRWWREAVPVPPHRSPTLGRPAARFDLGGGELLEVHRDDGGTYRAVLVRRRGADEEVRLLP
jgi:hypothetical protein